MAERDKWNGAGKVLVFGQLAFGRVLGHGDQCLQTQRALSLLTTEVRQLRHHKASSGNLPG